MNRIAALLAKELADLRHSPAVFLSAVLTALAAVLYPFFIAIVVPRLAGEQLSDSSDFQIAVEMYRSQPGTRSLSPEGAIQAWIFQQCLVLLAALTPVTASMSVAAHSVIGEKLARTLEPLLATPLTTFELLAGKLLGALLPALTLMVLCFGGYVAAVAAIADPGVWSVLLLPRSLAVVFVLGPLAALAALQLALCASSRVSDARSAQQVGALIVIPIAALQVAQLMNAFQLTVQMVLLIALALVAGNAALMWLAIRLFGRESILTRWK